MTKEEQQRVIIISAPSGTGKSTIIGALLKNNPALKFSISSTTRSPRNSEQDGIEYYFLTIEDFEDKKNNGEFLEFEYVHNNYYGTSLQAVENIIQENLYCILDIDVKGAKNLIQKFPYSKSIFILPPTLEILKKRLIARGDTPAHDIEIRMKNAQEEMEEVKHFKYSVVNDNLSSTIKRVEEIIYATK